MISTIVRLYQRASAVICFPFYLKFHCTEKNDFDYDRYESFAPWFIASMCPATAPNWKLSASPGCRLQWDCQKGRSILWEAAFHEERLGTLELAVTTVIETMIYWNELKYIETIDAQQTHNLKPSWKWTIQQGAVDTSTDHPQPSCFVNKNIICCKSWPQKWVWSHKIHHAWFW